LTYYTAWAEAVRSGGYVPAVYCSPLCAPDVQPLAEMIWIADYNKRFAVQKPFNFPTPDMSTSPYAQADAWQHTSSTLIFPGQLSSTGQMIKGVRKVEADFSSSLFPDPGYPLGHLRK
jgi:hypothetical protein